MCLFDVFCFSILLGINNILLMLNLKNMVLKLGYFCLIICYMKFDWNIFLVIVVKKWLLGIVLICVLESGVWSMVLSIFLLFLCLYVWW